jgi:hypothetical protein
MNRVGIFVLGLVCLLSFGFVPKKKIPFNGYDEVNECQIDLPVSYSTNKKGPFVKKSKELENVKIAMVLLDKHEKPKIIYYYLEITGGIDGENAVFVPAKDFEGNASRKSIIFMKYKKSKQFFYTADCLNEKLELNAELKDKFEIK